MLAYAAAGIREYWIVNLIDRQIEQYLDPQTDGTYAIRRIHHADRTFSSSIIELVSVGVLLP